MANPSLDRGGSPAPAPRRSRTRRDPSGDEVYRVPPQDFAHTVQKLTGAASQAPTTPSSGGGGSGRSSSLGLAAESPPRPSTTGPPAAAPALLVSTSTPRSMQEAYLAWCASNNVLLSPGTMAEIERGEQS